MLLSGGQATLGHIAVLIFFITSGFLITQSYIKNSNIIFYSLSRILRIFPGLIVVILLTSFVLGPLFTTESGYFYDPRTYTYLTNILLHPIENLLPGLFVNNTFAAEVNGSLWSLQYEFLFYIVIALLGTFKQLNKVTVGILFIASFLMSIIPNAFETTITRVPYLFTYFSAGMLLFLYKDKIFLNRNIGILSAIVMISCSLFGGLVIAFVFFGSYLLLHLSFTRKIRLYNFSKHGDFSYGLYIYAFPIQQMVTHVFDGKMNPLLNFAISYPIALIFAYFSWNFVEKKALGFKNKLVTSYFIPRKSNPNTKPTPL